MYHLPSLLAKDGRHIGDRGGGAIVIITMLLSGRSFRRGNVHEAFAARKGAQSATINTEPVVNASSGASFFMDAAATFSNCGNTLKSANTAARRETSGVSSWGSALMDGNNFVE